MSNLKGAILAMALWVGVVFPFLLMLGIDSFQQRAYLSVTERLAELVRQEGGVSPQVNTAVEHLKNKGYQVTFSKPSPVQFGEEIVIRYQYEYQNVKGKQKLDTQNKVVITKRVVKEGSDTSPKLPQTYNVTTAERITQQGEYTFRIPNLGNLQRVMSNTGKVEVVRVEGENVTVNVSGGAATRTVQTGEYSPADTKYVDGQTSTNYNTDGYKGTLESYLVSGEYLPAASKEIKNYVTSSNGRSCNFNPMFYTDGPMNALLGNWVISSLSGGYAYFDYEEEGFKGLISSDSCNTIAQKYFITEVKDEFNDYMKSLNLTGELLQNYYIQNHGKRKIIQSYKYVTEFMTWKQHFEDLKNGFFSAKAFVYTTLPLNGLTLSYSGTVTRPEIDTRVYAYRGYVTKPETDTRTYTSYYQYQLQFEYISN